MCPSLPPSLLPVPSMSSATTPFFRHYPSLNILHCSSFTLLSQCFIFCGYCFYVSSPFPSSPYSPSLPCSQSSHAFLFPLSLHSLFLFYPLPMLYFVRRLFLCFPSFLHLTIHTHTNLSLSSTNIPHRLSFLWPFLSCVRSVSGGPAVVCLPSLVILLP